MNAAPASTTTGAAPVESVQELLDEWAAQGRGGVAVAFANDDDEELTVAVAGSAGPDGDTLEPDAAFRVGSHTRSPEQLGNDLLEMSATSDI